MHIQGLPYRPFVRGIKYTVVNGKNGYEKGFSWFVDVGQTICLLERGRTVGIFPC